jgi:S-adenosyl methyltransferase
MIACQKYDHYLGGKDHFAADRETGDLILQMFLGIAQVARLQRRFLVRAVRYLAGEAGIRRFLDGSWLLPGRAGPARRSGRLRRWWRSCQAGGH